MVSDKMNHRIQIFDPIGSFLFAFGTQGKENGKLSYPMGVCADAGVHIRSLN